MYSHGLHPSKCREIWHRGAQSQESLADSGSSASAEKYRNAMYLKVKLFLKQLIEQIGARRTI